MNTQIILAEKATSPKNNNNVWFVYISGQRDKRLYCTCAFKAMRLMFLLKKRTGLNISENILTRLSHEVARQKLSTSALAQDANKSKAPQPKAEKPKKSRKAKSKVA